MIIICYLVSLIIALLVAISDIKERRISNVAVLVLAAVGLVLSLYTGIWIDWIIAVVAVVVGLAVFMLKCFGAGDVKYFWACMLVIPNQIEALLITTSLAGLVLAITYLAKHGFRAKEVGTLPYGVAISTGLALCLCRSFI